MAEQLNVDLIVKATAQGFEKIGQGMRGMGDSFKSTGRSIMNVGGDIMQTMTGIGLSIGGAVLATRQLYQALEEGAALQRSAQMFDNLAVSIGSTADVMLGKLRTATSGMVSDAQLIAGAGQIISLGLADTEDGVVRLSTLVSKLGWDMQQVIMTFANNSVMRLDALGLSVEDVNAKMKVLEATGMSADKAFDMAVIQAGEEKLKLLGDAAETTAGQLVTLEADWANLVNSMKTGLAEAVGPAIAGLAALSKAGSTTSAAIAEMHSETADVSDQLAALSSGLTEAVNSWLPTTAPVEEIRKAVIDLIKTQVDFTQGMMSAERQLQELNAGFDITSDGAIRLNGVIVGLYPDIRAVGLAWAEATEAAAADAAMLGNWSATAQETSQNVMLFAEGIGVSSDALIRHEKYLAAVAAGYTTAAGAIEAMRAAQKAAQEEQRTELGQEFVGEFDMGDVGQQMEIMIRAAADAGPATQALYDLAGGTEAVGDAMLVAAANVRAAQLGELVGQGLITAEEAIQDLQDFMDNTTLEDLFSFDTLLPDEGEQRQSLRDRLLGPAEGIVSEVGTAVTDAAKPAKDKIQELIDKLDEADESDPDIAITDDDVTTATGHVTNLSEALTALTATPWVVNVVYQTSGSVPGATDGATGSDNGAAPGGNAPASDTAGGGSAGSGRGRRGSETAGASSTVVNNFMNGVTVPAMAAAIAQGITRYTRSTR